jgi:hypothetical protein
MQNGITRDNDEIMYRIQKRQANHTVPKVENA